jgi:hypothetical protein
MGGYDEETGRDNESMAENEPMLRAIADAVIDHQTTP